VAVALGIQHAMRMRHIVICALPRFTIFSTLPHKLKDFRALRYFPHCLTNWKIFGKKKCFNKKKCLDFLYNFCL